MATAFECYLIDGVNLGSIFLPRENDLTSKFKHEY